MTTLLLIFSLFAGAVSMAVALLSPHVRLKKIALVFQIGLTVLVVVLFVYMMLTGQLALPASVGMR